jgi:hypothetical protein
MYRIEAQTISCDSRRGKEQHTYETTEKVDQPAHRTRPEQRRYLNPGTAVTRDRGRTPAVSAGVQARDTITAANAGN